MTGLGRRDDALHQAGAQREGGFVERAGRGGAQFAQVVAGAEGGAVGGDDDDADGVVVGDGLQGGVERLHQADGQRVAGGRTVQRQGRDVVAVVAEQDIGHDGRGYSRRMGQCRIGRPRGELSLRTVAMPADTNPAGDIFGGWIMSLMDLAAGVAAGTRAKGRVATAAVSNLSFLQPVKVGDVVCVYTEIRKTGRTSVTVGVEAYVLRRNQGERVRVTAAEFVLVAVDDQGVPRPLPRPEG